MTQNKGNAWEKEEKERIHCIFFFWYLLETVFFSIRLNPIPDMPLILHGFEKFEDGLTRQIWRNFAGNFSVSAQNLEFVKPVSHENVFFGLSFCIRYY